jgi:hypothetical protein
MADASRQSDTSRRPTLPDRPATDAPVKMYRPLPEGASIEQLMHAQHELGVGYANAFATTTQELPALRKVLGEVRTEMTADRIERKRIEDKLDELCLGVGGLDTTIRHVTGRVTAMEVLTAEAAATRLKLPSQPPSKNPSVPPMRRAQDTGSYILETSHRVGEAAKEKAQQIVDNPHTNLTPDVVGEIARAEAKEVLAQEREAQRTESLQALADKVEADRLETVELARVEATEKRERNRMIVVGVVVGVVMLAIGGLFTFAEGRARGHGEGFAERAAVQPLPVFLNLPAASALPSAPAAATGAFAPTKK